MTEPNPTPASSAPDDDWQRVHPASPFVRGWFALAAFAYFFGRDTLERMLQGRPLIDDYLNARVLWLALGGAALLLLTVVGFVLSWFFTRYQVSGGYVRVTSGLLFRQHRQARLDRVQAIDIVQPLLARIFGLAELKFEVADAGESAVRLAYLRLKDAKQLRATILARASGAETTTAARVIGAGPGAVQRIQGAPGAAGPHGDLAGIDGSGAEPGHAPASGTEPAPASLGPGLPGSQIPASLPPTLLPREAPEWRVLTVPPQRLLGSLVLSEQTVFIVLGAATSVVVSVLTESVAFAFALIPAILGIAANYWGSFNRGFNFTAAISPDGIRLRYGLLDTRAQTLPPGRIQAIKIHQPPLWRLLGWYRMQVNVAGYGGPSAASESSSRTMLLPVGLKNDVFAMLSLVLPDPGTGQPDEVFTAGMAGLGGRSGVFDGGFVITPRRARLIAPLGWRRNGFTATETALLLRSGRWWRELVVVPHQRIQSMALQQGPIARRFGVADVVLHTTPGPVTARLIQADVEAALALFDAQAARAREARSRQTSEQWLAQVAPAHVPSSPQTQEGPQHG